MQKPGQSSGEEPSRLVGVCPLPTICAGVCLDLLPPPGRGAIGSPIWPAAPIRVLTLVNPKLPSAPSCGHLSIEGQPINTGH